MKAFVHKPTETVNKIEKVQSDVCIHKQYYVYMPVHCLNEEDT